MTGLILKDFINLKKYLKTLLLIIIFYGIIFIPQGKSNFICSFLTLLAAMPAISAMTMDDYSKWNSFAVTMPVKRNDIVLSKYLLMLIFIIASGILSFIFLTATSVMSKSFNLTEVLALSVTFTCAGIIYDSIIIPIIFKMGSEKAKLIMLVVLLIPVGAAVLLSNVLSQNDLTQLTNFIDNIENILPVIIIGATILITVSSYFISTNIFAKKEL